MYYFLLKLLNIRKVELSRVVKTWFITFLNKSASVLGFTLLTIFIVSTYSVSYLPLVFLLHSFGIIVGSFSFNSIVPRFKKETLLVFFSLASAVPLFLSIFIAEHDHPVLFISILVLSLSVFMGQLKIVRMLFVETQFTPNQAVRVFPVIESAETAGVIFAGSIFAVLATLISFDKFVLIWVLILLSLVFFVIFCPSRSLYLQLEDIHIGTSKSFKLFEFSSYLGKIGSFTTSKLILPFVFIVLFQWIFFTTIEFEFTKQLQQISHGVELQSIGDSFESNFAVDLGNLQVYIGLSALFFQLILASRLLNYLGLVGSLLMYPIVLLVTFLSYLINPSFSSLLISRFGHEMSNVLHYNSYHACYYVFSHTDRHSLMEFIEGIVRPLGAVLAIAMLYGIAIFSSSMASVFSMFISLLVLLLVTVYFKFEFQEVPKNIILNSKSNLEIIDAIHLLKQNFDCDDVKFLINVLDIRSDLPKEIQVLLLSIITQYASIDDFSLLLLLDKDHISTSEFLDTISKLVFKFGNELRDKPFTNLALHNLIQKYINSSELIVSTKAQATLFSLICLCGDYTLVNRFDLTPELLVEVSDLLARIKDRHFLQTVKTFLNHTDSRVITSALYSVDNFIDHETRNRHVGLLLASDDNYHIENVLVYLLRLKLSRNYLDELYPMLNSRSLNPLVILLVNLCINLATSNYTKARVLFEGTNIEVLSLFSKHLKVIKDDKLTEVFEHAVELKIHDLLTNLLDSSQNFDDVLPQLERLFDLLDSKKDYYLVEALFK